MISPLSKSMPLPPLAEVAQAKPSGGGDFGKLLMDALTDLNKEQKTADSAARDVAIGRSENIHETMLALSEAEINFKMMVQVRNKALEAYQEVMRMPV